MQKLWTRFRYRAWPPKYRGDAHHLVARLGNEHIPVDWAARRRAREEFWAPFKQPWVTSWVAIGISVCALVVSLAVR